MDKSNDNKSEVVQKRASADSVKSGKGTTGIVPPPYQLFAANTKESELSDTAQVAITQLSSAGAADSPNDSGSPSGNGSGLPSDLKTGIESMSGYSMDDVTVHKNSNKPAQLQAHAYAQGSDIHLAPGQEKHLPHEAWHVVQQKQGRVAPSTQLKGYNINTDDSLEKEADLMGGKAAQFNGNESAVQLKKTNSNASVAQMKFTFGPKWVASIFGSLLGGWTQNQIDAEKARFDKLIDDLKSAANGLKEHNYYLNLNTFTSGKKKSEFKDLKSLIDTYISKVEGLEKETLLWSKKDEMEETIRTKSIEIENLMERFSNFSEDASLQAENENKVFQEQIEILKILGGSSSNYANKVDRHIRDKRKKLAKSKKTSTTENLMGSQQINTLKEDVTSIKSTYDREKEKYKLNQEELAEQRRLEKLEQEKSKLGAEALELKRQGIIAKLDGANIIEFERYFDSDYSKIETLIEHKGKLKASNVLNIARSANANKEENFSNFIALLNSNFDVNNGINLIKEKGANFIIEWKDYVNLFTDKNKLDIIIESSKEKDFPVLKNLLTSFNISGLNDLLKQTNYNYNVVNDLFTKPNHTKEEIAALQNTYAKESTIELLQDMPNTKKLLALTNTLSNEIELRNLIKDIKGKADATNVVENEIEQDAPSQATIYGNEEVQKARGLKGLAGNLLEAKKLSDISTDNEKRAIKATLDYINGGLRPQLTHDTNDRPAKFNENYGNGNGLLPAGGNYKEYYVQRPANSTTFHGSRRLVKDTISGRIYYTAEHYNSFCRLLT